MTIHEQALLMTHKLINTHEICVFIDIKENPVVSSFEYGL